MTFGVKFAFEGEVWFEQNPVAKVYFVSLPKEMSADILDLVGNALNPWGTVPVAAMIGDFAWETAMFPRKERGEYDLPLNGKVRKRLGIEAGQVVAVEIAIEMPA